MKQKSGVTLFELLCVMACLSILFLLVLPLGLAFRAELKLTAAVDQLRHVLSLAQGEAISRGRSVWVSGWARGQLILTTEASLSRSFAVVRGITIRYHGNLGRNDSIRFLPNGTTYGQKGHFDCCTQSTWVKPRCHSLILHFSGQTVG